ncbi:uncharacterized protein LOC125003853 isoform X2 [Mugil cephalus]|uniref:uncharacterized protein LOC125003853 isoform X2 n=1 Tax=Mugil cephalus TaxID=48193 RepID=UPI001FB7B0A1|nr:uncharacterized protein LOC125003853 isoform X2 [Mugil cephalus]
MKVQHTLICIFFFRLQGGNTDPAENIFYEVMGQNITIKCPVPRSQTWKAFCRESCETGTLITTTNDSAQSGKYSIKYNGGTSPVLAVSITKLTKSDTGLYICGSGRVLSSLTVRNFRIIVADALLDKNHNPSQTHFFPKPGSSLTVACQFSVLGKKKSLCRGECKEDEILVETNNIRAERDRYSIEYEEPSVLYVTLRELTTSDSGWYRCYLNRNITSSSYREFEIIVSDVSATSKPNLTQNTAQYRELQLGGTSADVMLYVGPSLVVTVILISVVMLIIYRKRSSKFTDPAGEGDYAAVAETNTVCEDIIEDGDRWSTSPTLGHDTLHTYATYSKPTGAGTHDDDDCISFIQHNTLYTHCKLCVSMLRT